MDRITSLPMQTVALSILFGAIAYYLARFSTVTLELTASWVLAVGLSFHILFWANKRNTSPGQLRALEYVYVVVGLLGVLGVLEVQSTVLQLRVKEIVSHYLTEDYNDMFCDQIEKLRPEFPNRDLEEGCYAEREMSAAYRAYDHERLKDFIDSGLNSKFESVRTRADWMQRMYKEMDEKVFRHFWDPKSPWWLVLRLLGFYMVFVGVAIKFAKTTAEICGWDKVTQERLVLEQV